MTFYNVPLLKKLGKPNKLSKVEMTKLKEPLVSKTEQEIFEATKLVIETTWSKSLRLEVDQTAKSIWAAICGDGKINKVVYWCILVKRKVLIACQNS